MLIEINLQHVGLLASFDILNLDEFHTVFSSHFKLKLFNLIGKFLSRFKNIRDSKNLLIQNSHLKENQIIIMKN